MGSWRVSLWSLKSVVAFFWIFPRMQQKGLDFQQVFKIFRCLVFPEGLLTATLGSCTPLSYSHITLFESITSPFLVNYITFSSEKLSWEMGNQANKHRLVVWNRPRIWFRVRSKIPGLYAWARLLLDCWDHLCSHRLCVINNITGINWSLIKIRMILRFGKNIIVI